MASLTAGVVHANVPIKVFPFGMPCAVRVLLSSSYPSYPFKGTETVLEEPGHYTGWFQNYPPGYGTPWDFVPELDWRVQGYTIGAVGSHNGCQN